MSTILGESLAPSETRKRQSRKHGRDALRVAETILGSLADAKNAETCSPLRCCAEDITATDACLRYPPLTESRSSLRRISTATQNFFAIRKGRAMAYPKRSLPYGFESAAKNAKNLHELAHKFRCSYEQLDRWCKEVGVKIEKELQSTPVTMCDLNTHDDIMSFGSIKQAAEYVLGDHSPISECAKGIRKSAYGYWWRLADDAS